MNFKQFLLNESKAPFNTKVNDILSAVHDLQADMPQMRNRQLAKSLSNIVIAIRPILRANWDVPKKSLAKLQQIGVAISKAIEDQADLKEITNTVAAALEELTGNASNRLAMQGEPATLPPSNQPMPSPQQQPPQETGVNPQSQPPQGTQNVQQPPQETGANPQQIPPQQPNQPPR